MYDADIEIEPQLLSGYPPEAITDHVESTEVTRIYAGNRGRSGDREPTVGSVAKPPTRGRQSRCRSSDNADTGFRASCFRLCSRAPPDGASPKTDPGSLSEPPRSGGSVKAYKQLSVLCL